MSYIKKCPCKRLNPRLTEFTLCSLVAILNVRSLAGPSHRLSQHGERTYKHSTRFSSRGAQRKLNYALSLFSYNIKYEIYAC